MALATDQKSLGVILTPDRRLRVFISSTLKELAEEREAVRQAVIKLRLLPVLFEAGARPHPAQELYQAYIAQSHIFIGIYWQSYGWIGPGMEISGLEDEFNRSARLPRLIYVKSPAPNREAGLERMLARLKQEGAASYKHFSSSPELGNLVENDLALLLSEAYESASKTSSEMLAASPLTNVPNPRNPLLGRAGELETLRSWLSQKDVGLVTLTGAGGAGKSRLALEVALELRNEFADGVYLVQLTLVSDAARVIPAIAETLGLRELPRGNPVEEVLKTFLRGKRMLLLLDNFEQVLQAAPKIGELLEACTDLKILVTSRSALRVRGERELFVKPLPVPDPNWSSDWRQLAEYPSVGLFVQRAQSVRPEFRLSDENGGAVAEISRRLEGLPLAIELAAARMKLLTPQDLLRRLSHRFEVLRGGTRDLPERQQTMRGAIDWSFNLLPEPARALFRRLAVFAGGFSMDAAEAVGNPDGDPEPSLLDQMETLVDSSLLSPVEGLEGQRRFGMLESLREYGLEQLGGSGEAKRVHRLHAEFYLKFASEVEPRVRSAERVRWRQILEQDLDNIRTAMDWTRNSPEDLEIGEALAVALTYFWATVSGYMGEGRRQSEAFVRLMNEKTQPAIRAKLLTLTGGLSFMQGDPGAEASNWAEIVQIARRSGDKRALGTALLLGGAWALASNDLVGAAQYFEECLPLYRELSDEWSQALAEQWLANAYVMAGQAGRAEELFESALARARKQGDPWLLADPLLQRAQGEFSKGSPDQAESTLLEVESVLRTLSDPWHLSWALTALAHIQLSRGGLILARTDIAEALQLGRQYGNLVSQIIALAETAFLVTLLYSREGTDPELRRLHFENAARLCGAALPHLDRAMLITTPGTRASYDGVIKQVQAAIEPEIWEQGFREGTCMPLEHALDLAADELREAIR